jgi:hypothetical protein
VDFEADPFVVRSRGAVAAVEGELLLLGGGAGPGESGSVRGCPVKGPVFTGTIQEGWPQDDDLRDGQGYVEPDFWERPQPLAGPVPRPRTK